MGGFLFVFGGGGGGGELFVVVVLFCFLQQGWHLLSAI